MPSSPAHKLPPPGRHPGRQGGTCPEPWHPYHLSGYCQALKGSPLIMVWVGQCSWAHPDPQGAGSAASPTPRASSRALCLHIAPSPGPDMPTWAAHVQTGGGQGALDPELPCCIGRGEGLSPVKAAGPAVLQCGVLEAGPRPGAPRVPQWPLGSPQSGPAERAAPISGSHCSPSQSPDGPE